MILQECIELINHSLLPPWSITTCIKDQGSDKEEVVEVAKEEGIWGLSEPLIERVTISSGVVKVEWRWKELPWMWELVRDKELEVRIGESEDKFEVWDEDWGVDWIGDNLWNACESVRYQLSSNSGSLGMHYHVHSNLYFF